MGRGLRDLRILGVALLKGGKKLRMLVDILCSVVEGWEEG